MNLLVRNSVKNNSSLGVSLIELLVALAIGLFLIFGITQVYLDSKQAYTVNDAVARLQETARYAMSVMEPDIRMANSWGLMNDPIAITVSNTGPANCGASFTTNKDSSVQGFNNSYGFTGIPCTPGGTGAVLSADSLVIRHAAATLLTAPTANTLQVCSSTTAAEISILSSCTTTTPPTVPPQRLNDLVSNFYFVSRDSTQAAGLPSLRRWSLIAGPAYQEFEVIPGIEDMQVQFAVSANGNSAEAIRYVNPDSVPVGAQVVAVRLWLLVRAENPEAGFIDNGPKGAPYEYGDRLVANGTVTNLNAVGAAGKAYQPGDGYRRLLVSRTIQIRSAVSRTAL